MKKTILLGISAVAAASLMCGCADEWGPSRSGSGRIAPIVGLDTEAASSRSDAPRSRAEGELTADDLSVRLTKADGSYANTWERLGDFSPETEFSVGDYSFEVYYGTAGDEGFEKPYYYGSQNINVADGKTTTLALTASLANTMISINYTDAFKKYMTEWSADVTGKSTHTYADTETRPIYLSAGEVEITVKYTTPSGFNGSASLPKLAAEARHHYVVTVDVNDGGVGDATLNISFPEELAVEDITIDLSDKLLATDPPTTNAVGFTPGTALDVVAGLSFKDDLSITTTAQAKVQNVILETSSASLLAQGWPAEIDLMQADEAQKATLQGLGLKILGLWTNPDQMGVIDFAGVLSHIKVLAAGDNTTTFTVTTKDRLSRASEPMTLTLNVEGVQLELSSAGEYFSPGENFKLKLAFNGTDVAENVKFTYLNPNSGTAKALEIVEVSAPNSRAMSDYIVTLAGPDLEEELLVTATCGGVSSSYTLPLAPFDITVADNDVYATYAYAKVTAKEGENFDVSSPSFLIRAEGETEFKTASATAEGNYYKISGLTPATNYEFKAQVSGMRSKSAAGTTESVFQLPNNELEEWSSGNKHNYWQVDYPSATAGNEGPWGTLNLLTTSEGGSAGAPGCGYSAKSGTTPVSGAEAYEGSTGALIQTVGWGGSNTVADALGIFAKFRCDNRTPGELYLGVYDAANKTANYSGIACTSRPSSLSFYSKYIAKNSADYGTAEIRVLDAKGAVIRSNTVQLTNSEFDTVTVPLTYAPSLAKAAKIVVIFKSSANASCLELNETNFTYPPKTTVTTAQGYIGSKLYVDHIILNY